MPKKLKNSLSLSAIVVLTFAGFLLTPAAQASTVSGFSDTLSNVTAGTSADHRILFVTPTGVDSLTDTITLTFGPAGPPTFSMGSIGVGDIDLGIDTSAPFNDCSGAFTEKPLASSPGLGTWGVSVSGQVITFTAPTDAIIGEIPAGDCVRVLVGQNASFGGAGVNQITNPSTAGSYLLQLGGTFGDSGGAAIAIANDSTVGVTATVVNGGGGGGGQPPPPSISGVHCQNVTDASFHVLWNTDIASSSAVDYGTTISYGNTASVPGLVFSHDVPISGLTSGTTYHYRVRSTGSGTTESVSGDFTCATTDTTPPVISNVQATNITGTSATITWDTNEDSDSKVDYGTTVSYGSSVSSATLTNAHSLNLTGLTPNTVYHFRVVSKDASNNTATSADFTFMTKDTIPPAISSVGCSNVTQSSFRANWTTDELADSRVEYGTTVSYGSTVSDSALVANHQITVSPLLSGTLYHYHVISADASGNSSTSTDQTCTTLADTTPPANVSNLTATPGNSQNTLTWTNPTDADFAGVRIRGSTTGYPSTPASGYAVYDGTGTSVVDTGLTNGTLYYYTAFAYDTSGNFASGAIASATPHDNVPPGPVINFTVSPGNTLNDLSWTNPSDADFSNVVIRRSTTSFPGTPTSGTLVYSGAGQSFSDTGLTNGVTYYYSIFARDTSNNFSTPAHGSGTPFDNVPPGPVTNFVITPGDTTNQLNWDNPTDPDFSLTQIQRSTTGYPPNPTSGTTVYTAGGTSYLDTGLTNGVTYYYSAFAKDSSGNYAPAAHASGTPSSTPPPPPTCGNNVCEGGETSANCPADCPPPPPTCGNNVCDPGETNTSCPADCPAGPPPAPVCGDTVCESGETNASCPADCPAPVTPPPQTAPKRIDRNLIQYDGANRTVLLHRDAQGAFHDLTGSTFSVVIPTSALPQPTTSIVMDFNGSAFIFRQSADGSFYYVDVQPPATGSAPRLVHGTIIITYADGTNDVVDFDLIIDPYGYVYETTGGTVTRVPGATVTLYQRVGGAWQAWNGPKFAQVNPQVVGAQAAFGYMVEPGEYYLHAMKDGYRPSDTDPFTVSTDVVNINIELIRIPKSITEVIIPGAQITENIGNVARNVGEQVTYLTKIIRKEIIGNPNVRNGANQIGAPVAAVITTIAVVTAIQAGNLLSYLYFIITQPLLLIGRKKRKEYGTVYNALTRLPIDLTIVRLFRTNGRLVRTLVTDKQGRYAFLVEEGEYRIEATKPGYTFPSEILKGRKEDREYIDLYHGELIQVGKDGAIITANIPLDPIESVKTNRRLILEDIGKKLQNFLAFASIIFNFIVYLLYRRFYILVIVIIQIILYFLFRRLARPPQPKNWGIIYDEKTKKPIPFAVARVVESQYNKVLESRVTDSKGRYNFLVGNNKYFVTVEKAGYEPKKSAEVDLTSSEKGGGVLGLDIGLNPTAPQPPGPKPEVPKSEATKPEAPKPEAPAPQVPVPGPQNPPDEPKPPG